METAYSVEICDIISYDHRTERGSLARAKREALPPFVGSDSVVNFRRKENHMKQESTYEMRVAEVAYNTMYAPTEFPFVYEDEHGYLVPLQKHRPHKKFQKMTDAIKNVEVF